MIYWRGGSPLEKILHSSWPKMFMSQFLGAKAEALLWNRCEFSNLSRLQKACLTALWSNIILYEASHKPISAKPIRRMWGSDEIGLFNSLYRNMLMQDDDSLIACYYGMYWRPDMSTVTEMIVSYTKMQIAGLLKDDESNFYWQVWCCWRASF